MKWQGLEIELEEMGDGGVRLFVSGLSVLHFLPNKKVVSFVENGITLHRGVESIVKLDNRRKIDDPPSFCEPITIPLSGEGDILGQTKINATPDKKAP